MILKKPLIGITTYNRDEHNQFRLPGDYVDAVRRAGGLPILLPPGEADPGQLLALVDGLILSGGGDIAPELYQGRFHETIYMTDAERDQSEIKLTQQYIATGLPLLGICRGLQVLNVALGGSLIEHLPDEVGDTVLHRQLAPGPGPIRSGPIAHPVTLAPASHLAEIMDASQVSIASWHHQAIRRLAPGLVVVAQAADNTIEAVEMPDHPWLVALQWHPELTAATDPAQQRIFEALVQTAAGNGRLNP
jgi:putative glutamine amidotransferase